MKYGIQGISRSSMQSLRLLIFGLTIILFVVVISHIPVQALTQPITTSKQSSSTSILLTYSEAAPSSEIEMSGGIIGHIEAIFSGKQEAPLHALFKVNVSGKLHKSKTEPWKVTLILDKPQEHIGDQISQKVNLRTEAQFMMGMLEPWSIDLSKEQVKACERDGKITIKLEGPMDVLQTWDGPESITLTVMDPDKLDKVARISYVRQSGDVFTPIYIVLYNEEFYIQVRFEKPPKKAFKSIDLEIGGIKTHQMIIERSESNPAIYRSDPLFLVEPQEKTNR